MSETRLSEPPASFLRKHVLRAADTAGDPQARAAIAASVSTALAEQGLSESERRIAIDIVGILAGDVVDQVREALAEHIKHCPLLPPAIARRLANDIETVAIPVIECSSALSDADLIEIVASDDAAKQTAIARRADVSASVAQALAETRRETVVRTLLENKGATLEEAAFHRLLRDFEANPHVLELVVGRDALPLTVAERLIDRVSATLGKQLVERHGLPADMAGQIAAQGRERSLVAWLKKVHNTAAVDQLVARLKADRSLTPTLILRALCEGDLHFFEAAMASLADVPIDNARRLIDDPGQHGLKRLYQTTGLPKHLYRAFRGAIEVIRGHRAQPVQPPISATIREIITRLVSDYRDLCPADLESTLSMLSRRIQETDGNPFEIEHEFAVMPSTGPAPRTAVKTT